MSRTTASGRRSPTLARAWGPPAASSTRYPSYSRIMRRLSRIAASSSTTRTEARKLSEFLGIGVECNKEPHPPTPSPIAHPADRERGRRHPQTKACKGGGSPSPGRRGVRRERGPGGEVGPGVRALRHLHHREERLRLAAAGDGLDVEAQVRLG